MAKCEGCGKGDDPRLGKVAYSTILARWWHDACWVREMKKRGG